MKPEHNRHRAIQESRYLRLAAIATDACVPRKKRGRIVVCLVRLRCRRCRKRFEICRSCFRNHAYCGKQCSGAARRQAKQDWQHDHRQTEAGREEHREQEKERRCQRRIERLDRVGRHTSPAGHDCRKMASNLSPTGKDAGDKAYNTELQTADEDAPKAIQDEPEQALGDRGPLQTGGSHRCAFCGRAGHFVARFPRRPTGRSHGARRLPLGATRLPATV